MTRTTTTVPRTAHAGFTTEELEGFERDGFAIVRSLVNDEFRTGLLQATFDGLANPTGSIEYEAELGYPGAPESRHSHGGDTIRRLKQAHARGEVFTSWLCDPGLGTCLQQLLGPRVYCPLAHHNCVMTKQPRHSSDTGWHRDIRYWSFPSPELVSVWVALGRETEENGSLRVIRGSHRWELAADAFDEAAFLTEVPEPYRAEAESPVVVELEPGDVLFFHCRTFHAASRNHTAEPKFSVVFTFRGEGNPPVPGSRSASLPEILLPER